jgi:hypothetical protein
MIRKIACASESRDWISRLPSAKKLIVTRLIYDAQAQPDNGIHYVFSGYPNPCHAVIEINSDEQKCYVLYLKDPLILCNGKGFGDHTRLL